MSASEIKDDRMDEKVPIREIRYRTFRTGYDTTNLHQYENTIEVPPQYEKAWLQELFFIQKYEDETHVWSWHLDLKPLGGRNLADLRKVRTAPGNEDLIEATILRDPEDPTSKGYYYSITLHRVYSERERLSNEENARILDALKGEEKRWFDIDAHDLYRKGIPLKFHIDPQPEKKYLHIFWLLGIGRPIKMEEIKN